MKRKTGLLIFSLVLFIESESMFHRQKTKLYIYHLCTYESFPRKGRTRNGLSGVGRKLRNHTSPHIHKMCKYALFKFHIVFKLPRFLVIWKYPDSFGTVK